jgi:membrane-associated phospholipid phosphatase
VRPGAGACAALCSLVLLAGTCRAEAPPAAPPCAERGAPLPSLGDCLAGIPADLVSGTKAIASPRVLPWAFAGAAATGAAFAFDDRVRAWFLGHDALGGASHAGYVLGLGTTHAAVAAGLLVAGGATGSRREVDAGVTVAEALVVNELVTDALKAIVHRERPGNGAHDSFPSGHASGTAALSASLAAVYGWPPGLTVPLGILTAFVGASRLADDAHWFSDVVGGVAIGGVIGAAFGNDSRDRRASSWTVLPFPSGGGGGLLLARAF